MRKLFSLCVIGTLFLILGFTWEGKFNPDGFCNWKIVNQFPTDNLLIVFQVRINPDENSSPKKVLLMVFIVDGTLLGYRYFEDGKPYSFVFNDVQDRYLEYKFSLLEIRNCMRCHKDKFRVLEENI